MNRALNVFCWCKQDGVTVFSYDETNMCRNGDYEISGLSSNFSLMKIIGRYWQFYIETPSVQNRDKLDK